MKTIVYIDGFNFYYSTYRNPRKREANSYKWLDFKKLLNNLLHDKHEIVAIKYYTADVSGKNDPDQPTRQHTYLRALKTHIPELEIHKGMFLTSERHMPKVDGSGNEIDAQLPSPIPGTNIRKPDRWNI